MTQLKNGLLSLFLLTSLILAGCAGDAGPTPAGQPSGSVAAPEEIVEDAGSIAGVILDDQALPIEGATVALVEKSLQVQSNAAGAFEFQNLAAGTYRLAAVKLGYSSAAKAVVVNALETTSVTLQMAPIAIEEVYHETVGPLNGYFQCRASVYQGVGGSTGTCGFICPPVAGCVSPLASVFSNDNSILKFNISSDHVASVVGEMRWSPSAYGTSGNMRFAFSYERRVSSHWWCSGEGPSPLKFVWHAEGDSRCANVGATTNPDKPTRDIAPLRLYANVPFASTSSPVNLAYEQRFEMMGTIFYGEPAPEGFSGLPDT